MPRLAGAKRGFLSWAPLVRYLPQVPAFCFATTGRLFLLTLILAHVLGAMVEHFVSGHRVIRRML
jgi:cytochrome b561